MIRFKNVSFAYNNENYVIKNLSLDINKGQFIAILGENASGKSTLARLANALIIPQEGYVEVEGLLSKEALHCREIRKKVALLQADPNHQFVTNIVEEEIAFGPENLGLSSHEIKNRVEIALKSVSMEDYKKYPPYLLSGGQKQKIALAALLAMNPDYLVLDEPTTLLDKKSKAEVMSILLRLWKEEGKSIILITHQLDEVLCAEHILVLKKGRINLEGKPIDILPQLEFLQENGIKPLEISKLIREINFLGDFSISDKIFAPDKLVDKLCQLK